MALLDDPDANDKSRRRQGFLQPRISRLALALPGGSGTDFVLPLLRVNLKSDRSRCRPCSHHPRKSCQAKARSIQMDNRARHEQLFRFVGLLVTVAFNSYVS